ncbi:hypothetical protein ABID47_003491 [Paenibacillus favisporus]|uniref:Uncharacterized protein n=1 Tax=Paenibacillus favisporus TaxID=221028 RepID=A0ABV2F559_9BACL
MRIGTEQMYYLCANSDLPPGHVELYWIANKIGLLILSSPIFRYPIKDKCVTLKKDSASHAGRVFMNEPIERV